MSAAPPVPFATMEDTLGDTLGDTMEMGSPYPGNADDFEIDLDIMEDQPFNADNDLDVIDVSPDAFNQPLSTVDQPTNDADMMDEIPEQAMINAFQHTPEAPLTGNMFYQGQEAYESEMLDDEYDEDIDAPFPDTKDGIVSDNAQALGDHEGIITTQNPEEPDPVQGEDQELHPDTKEGALPSEDNGTLTNQKNLEGSDARDTKEEPAEVMHSERSQESKQHNEQSVTNTTARVPSPALEDTETHVQQSKGEVTGINNAINLENETERQSEVHDYGEIGEQHSDESQRVPHLYPVKVLYQDSEISLFPPQEGDSSETFFLEDEGLAHGDFGKLLASCRRVLGEHVGDDESLVVDIESLNLQLSEASH
jgi:hypothetical protein